MTKVLIGLWLLLSLAVPSAAAEMTAPEVPQAGIRNMPQESASFGNGLTELIHNGMDLLYPEMEAAVQISFKLLVSVMLLSLLSIMAESLKQTTAMAGTVVMASVMFQHARGMISYAADMVLEICEYGKLLCPVLTTALAAQGGITASAALYGGTTVFITLLSMLVSRLIVPMVNLYLVFSVVHCALGEETAKKCSDAVKTMLNWLLKTLLIVFTTYMSITGVVSGTTDAAALKAAKVAFSTAVPVVGSILSDASEAVLISVETMKNAAGVYGILAVLAVFLGPFIKIGVQYLLLKVTTFLCGLFAEKNFCALMEDFSSAMGLLLAMVAAGCVLILVSTVCFLKGIG